MPMAHEDRGSGRAPMMLSEPAGDIVYADYLIVWRVESISLNSFSCAFSLPLGPLSVATHTVWPFAQTACSTVTPLRLALSSVACLPSTLIFPTLT